MAAVSVAVICPSAGSCSRDLVGLLSAEDGEPNADVI
jgi:hypothetical protein